VALSQRDRCNTLWRRAQGIIRKNVRPDHWRVGVIHAPIHTLLTADRIPTVHWFNELTRGEFLADPFGVMHDGRLTLLCESFDYRTARGTITSIDSPAERRVRREHVLIGPNVHLSYPYLVEHDGDVFCIPETHEAREIGLYRADPFPGRWVKIATLVAGFAGVDATVFQLDGRWWLACTDADHEPNRDLHLWYAADLRGPWQPHAGNPVKRDLRSARPAGTPFVHEGCLYRPAQDCSRAYGGQVVINRVTRLSPTEFQEEPAAVIDPVKLGGAPDGVHTISAVGPLTLIDARWSMFVPRVLARAIIDTLARREPRRRARRTVSVPGEHVPAPTARMKVPEPRPLTFSDRE